MVEAAGSWFVDGRIFYKICFELEPGLVYRFLFEMLAGVEASTVVKGLRRDSHRWSGFWQQAWARSSA